MVNKDDKILIVGAGCFGISTAYHLLKRGFTDITAIDRSEVLPAPDAASTDINKSEYIVLPDELALLIRPRDKSSRPDILLRSFLHSASP